MNRGPIGISDTDVVVVGGAGSRAVIRRVKTTLKRGVLEVRNERGFAHAQEELAELREEVTAGRFRADGTMQLTDLREALNLLDAGTLMIETARARKETRGSHYREDYPQTESQGARPIMVRQTTQRSHAAAGDFIEVIP